MQIFYAPGIEGRSHTLDETESRHCIKVLRMTKGTAVKVIDGKGNLFEGFISDPDIKKCVIAITSEIKDYEKRDYYLHIAISPLKNPERFEWFIEKSVEIGVDEITPLICRHTEKQSIKQERTENIIISAMKQSLKAKKPVLNSPVFFDDFIKCKYSGKKMIAHCINELHRSNFSEVYKKGDDAIITIGPEGDFSESEVGSAIQAGFVPFHMGQARLRTETAGIAACHSVYFINSES